jgi:lysyl-tRNA synthetase class 2
MYADGIELANGFEELADATEQRTRFAADNAARAATGLPQLAVDEQLLGALEAGLPPCAGVALGFDRLVMVATGARRIDDVMAFPVEIA